MLCARELSTLPQTTSSVSHTFIYLWRAATISTTRCHQLPRLSHTSATLAQYLATFRTFWRHFFHNRDILTNLATSLKKLNYRSVGGCLQYCLASARSDSRRSVATLSASVLSSEQQSIQPTRQKIIYKTAFPSTCRLLTVWTIKYEHKSSVNMCIVCYSDSGSALNQTKVI